MFKHFDISEFRCRETGENDMDESFIHMLDELRELRGEDVNRERRGSRLVFGRACVGLSMCFSHTRRGQSLQRGLLGRRDRPVVCGYCHGYSPARTVGRPAVGRRMRPTAGSRRAGI